MHHQPALKQEDLTCVSVCDLNQTFSGGQVFQQVEEWIGWELSDKFSSFKDYIFKKFELNEEEGFWAFESEQNEIVCAFWKHESGWRFGVDIGKESEKEVAESLAEFFQMMSVKTNTKKPKRIG